MHHFTEYLKDKKKPDNKVKIENQKKSKGSVKT